MPVTKNGSFTDYDQESISSVGSTGSNSLNDWGGDKDSVSSSDDDDRYSDTVSTNKALGLDKGEAFVINLLRCLFFVFVFSAAAVLGWMVFLTSRRSQEDDFDSSVSSRMEWKVDTKIQNTKSQLLS